MSDPIYFAIRGSDDYVSKHSDTDDVYFAKEMSESVEMIGIWTKAIFLRLRLLGYF